MFYQGPSDGSRYSGDGEAQQARCFCVGVRERNYYMATGLKGMVVTTMPFLQIVLALGGTGLSLSFPFFFLDMYNILRYICKTRQLHT